MSSRTASADFRRAERQVMGVECPLDRFVDDLRKLPDTAFSDMGRMLAFLAANPVDPVTLESCLVWDQRHYTRNLIDRTAVYELIAICWDIGQVSAIHDHDDQHCWMSIPIGKLLIENYHVLNHDVHSGRCVLKNVSTVEMHSEQPQAVDPESPVHRVSNLREFNQRAVSLHIYSRPIDKCLVYSEQSQLCGLVTLTYTSTPESRSSGADRRML